MANAEKRVRRRAPRPMKVGAKCVLDGFTRNTHLNGMACTIMEYDALCSHEAGGATTRAQIYRVTGEDGRKYRVKRHFLVRAERWVPRAKSTPSAAPSTAHARAPTTRTRELEAGDAKVGSSGNDCGEAKAHEKEERMGAGTRVQLVGGTRTSS